jgi:hypoxanthine phosphoribosyltransferase
MIDLDFLSYAQIHRRIVETIPALRRFPITAVTYVPRGGSAIAAIVCQILDVPLVSPCDLNEIDLSRCLLVDDMLVTGHSLAAFRRRYLPDHRAMPTYIFATVPRDRVANAEIDITSMVVDPVRYLLLPWEIGDIFRPIFPFPILVDLDGVIRSPADASQAILSTPHVIAHLLSFRHDVADDRRWLTAHGYRFDRLTSLPDPDDAGRVAGLIRENRVRFYLTSDPRRGAILKRLCPECHIVAFPEMIEM